jgi:tetratricopeptide (TPR) repeat protein
MIFRFQGDLNSALKDFSSAIDINPNYAWAWAYRSVISVLMKNYEGAWNDLMRAIALDPFITTRAGSPMKSMNNNGEDNPE